MARTSLRGSLYLAVLLALSIVPIIAHGRKVTSTLVYVNDLPRALNQRYTHDLETRLFQLEGDTGLAIHILLVPPGTEESLVSFAAEHFETHRLAEGATNGAVLVVLDISQHRASIKTSRNIADRFARSGLETKIANILQGNPKERELAIEMTIDRVLRQLNWWFYVFEPSPAKV